MKITNSGKRLTASNISQAESQLGFRFPSELTDFLKKHNGGYPDCEVFSYHTFWPGELVSGEPHTSLLSHFLGVRPTEPSEDIVETAVMFANRIPRWLLPIARDAGGNVVAIAYTGHLSGRLFYWDHEAAVDTFSESLTSVYYVADNFRSFIRSLSARPRETERERVIRLQDLEGLNRLLSEGYELEVEDKYGMTIVESAAFYNALQLVVALLQRGANPRSAAQYAREEGWTDLASIIDGYA